PGHPARRSLLRFAAALVDAGRLLQQHGRRRRLCNEAEGTISVNGDFHRDDGASLIGGAGVEILAEAHDVQLILTQGGSHRARRARLARRHLELDHTDSLFSHAPATSPPGYPAADSLQAFDLAQIQFQRGLPAEHGDQNLQLALFRVDVVDDAHEAFEGPGTNFNTLTHVEVNLGPGMLHAHLLPDVFDLFGQEGKAAAAGSDDPRHARGVAHHVPRRVGQLHLDQDVAGETLLLNDALLAVLGLDVLFHGHDDVEGLVFHAHGDHPLLQVGLHFVFIAGISVDDIPRSGRAGAE